MELEATGVAEIEGDAEIGAAEATEEELVVGAGATEEELVAEVLRALPGLILGDVLLALDENILI